ncbi:MAG: hypothetical protein ACI9N0_000042 [Ilumatobacter sp.]|jgi:hypothetical protein
MSTTTLISQRIVQRLPFHAPIAPHSFAASGHAYVSAAAPVHAVPAITGNAVVTGLGNGMAWLGGLGENVCVSKKQFTKRIATGNLDRVLT